VRKRKKHFKVKPTTFMLLIFLTRQEQQKAILRLSEIAKEENKDSFKE